MANRKQRRQLKRATRTLSSHCIHSAVTAICAAAEVLNETEHAQRKAEGQAGDTLVSPLAHCFMKVLKPMAELGDLLEKDDPKREYYPGQPGAQQCIELSKQAFEAYCLKKNPPRETAEHAAKTLEAVRDNLDADDPNVPEDKRANIRQAISDIGQVIDHMAALAKPTIN